jgi:hypothetical protein
MEKDEERVLEIDLAEEAEASGAVEAFPAPDP